MTAQQTGAPGSPFGAGLLAGSIAAIAASLLQLPLHAPTDTVFNSATVAAGAILAGLVAGVTWWVADGSKLGSRLYFAIWAAVFGGVVLLAFQASSQVDRSVSYIVPVGAVVIASVALLTPWLAGRSLSGRWWIVLLTVALAVGVGAGLASIGDQESGRLELPAKSSRLI